MYYGTLKSITYFSLNCDKALTTAAAVRDKPRVDHPGKRP